MSDEISTSNKPVFRELQADDPEPETTEIESLCVNCGENVRKTFRKTGHFFFKPPFFFTGHYQAASYKNPFLQGNHFDVLRM